MNFSTTEILQNSAIVAELKQAWQDSEPNVSGGHEEGGFIVVDDFGFLSVVRWEKGTQNEIVLPPHKNYFVGGKAIVASHVSEHGRGFSARAEFNRRSRRA